MNKPNPIIQRYASGEISAMRAADLLGGTATVADVITLLHQAALCPPLPPPDQQRAELAHARRVLGLQPQPHLPATNANPRPSIT